MGPATSTQRFATPISHNAVRLFDLGHGERESRIVLLRVPGPNVHTRGGPVAPAAVLLSRRTSRGLNRAAL